MSDYAAGRIASEPTNDRIDESTHRASRAAWFALCVLLAVLILRYVDQVVLTIGTEPMRKALALSDAQLGLLQGLGLTLATALGSVPLAWLADRYDRRWVLAACIVFWSAATAVRGLGQSFEVIMVSTIGMSLAEASLIPIAYAIIPSLFHGRQRATANLIFYAGGALGYSLAMMLGGGVFATIDAHAAAMPAFLHGMESWRTASFAVAIVGPLFAALVITIRDRQHSNAQDHRAPQRASKGELSRHLRAHWRTVAGVFGAAAAGGAALGPLMAWLPIAMARRFQLSPAEIGAQLGGIFFVATIVGIAMSGLMVRVWGRRLGDLLSVRTAPYLTGFSAIPLASFAFIASAPAAYLAIFLIIVPLIAFNAGMPIVYQGIAPSHVRARLMAAASAIAIVAGALGPIAVGYLSDSMGQSENALLTACAVMGVPLTLISATLMRWAEKHIRATLAAVLLEDDAERERM